MMVDVTYQMVLSTLQTVGLLVGIFYYVTTLRNAQKTRELALKSQEQALETRQIQLFMQIYKDVNTEKNLLTFSELINPDTDIEENQQYNPNLNPTFNAKRIRLWYSYNTIGELLREHIIEKELLHRLNIDLNVILLWEKWEGFVQINRKTANMPDLWAGFEYLYNEMKNIRNSKGYPDITYNP